MVLLSLLVGATSADAGLYYSAEEYASLPSQWRGFLLDHRQLRNISVNPKDAAEIAPIRQSYLKEAEKLQARADKGPLTPDEAADLGAIHIRLGSPDRAIELLRKAHQAHPNHFAIAANLGTAWQQLGDLRQAEAALEQAVRLAPGKYLATEQAHLKLVRLRQRSQPGELDDLFGIRFVADKGGYEPGKLATTEMKKLPTKAIAIAQQLALWLPADGRLLWQLAELSNAHGDPRSAANMMEGCVVQFGMANPTLRKHRQLLRDVVEELPKAKLGADKEHAKDHVSTIAFRSRRPLISKFESLALPPIDAKGINTLPWELFHDTVIEKPFKASFPRYLQELQGKQVSLLGFMYPLRDDPEVPAFMFIEAPVGCWYCEMPETSGIVFVEMPPGQSTRYQRGLVRIVGRLLLNTSDPEEFLYTVKDARVGALD